MTEEELLIALEESDNINNVLRNHIIDIQESRISYMQDDYANLLGNFGLIFTIISIIVAAGIIYAGSLLRKIRKAENTVEGQLEDISNKIKSLSGVESKLLQKEESLNQKMDQIEKLLNSEEIENAILNKDKHYNYSVMRNGKYVNQFYLEINRIYDRIETLNHELTNIKYSDNLIAFKKRLELINIEFKKLDSSSEEEEIRKMSRSVLAVYLYECERINRKLDAYEEDLNDFVSGAL